MDPMAVVEAWDRTLRAGDWQAARSLLADDAIYIAPGTPEDGGISCTTPDQIVDLMRTWKGRLPDVEVVGWEAHDEHVLARLRQPAFGDDSDWFQVLSVRDGLIAKLEDYPTRESAVLALEQRA
jgi:ketosteroid isomerase-like protein